MKKRSLYQYPVLVEPCEEGGFFAACPYLPGCHVQGDSLQETLEEMRAAMDAYLLDLRACGEPIPQPRQVAIVSIGVNV